MIDVEIGTTVGRLVLVVVTAMVMLAGIIVYIRIAGLRSFSKMSSFDFAVTVAFGSLLAAVAMSNSSLADGLAAAAALLAMQYVIARLRLHGFATVVDNRPLLLMVGDQMIQAHLSRSRVTESDIRAKLREANVSHPDQIGAVVLEATGDISVLHHCDAVHPSLLEGVIGANLTPG